MEFPYRSYHGPRTSRFRVLRIKLCFVFHLCLGNFVGQFGVCTASCRYLGLTVFVSTVLRDSGGTFRCSPGVGDLLLLLPGL